MIKVFCDYLSDVKGMATINHEHFYVYFYAGFYVDNYNTPADLGFPKVVGVTIS